MRKYMSLLKEQYEDTKKLRSEYYHDLLVKSFGIIGRDRFKRYLDIGCCTGEIAYLFRNNVESIEAVDINQSYLDKAKVNFSEINFTQMSVYDLKFKYKFDLISAFSLLEHLDDLDKALGEIHKNLKKSGYFFIQIPNKYFSIELHTYLPFLYLIPTKLKIFLLKRLRYSEDAIFATQLSLRKLKGKLSKFKIINIEKLTYPPEIIPRNFRYIYKLLYKSKFFQIVPFGYFIICQPKY